MEHIASLPWSVIDRNKTEGVDSIVVVDANERVLCQALRYGDSPRAQALEHAALWAAAPELAMVVRSMMGAALAARESGKTEYEGVAAHWSSIRFDAKRALKMLTPNVEVTGSPLFGESS